MIVPIFYFILSVSYDDNLISRTQLAYRARYVMQVSHFMIFSQFFSSWFELCQMKMIFLLLKVKDLRIPHSNLCGVLRFLTFIHHLLSFNHFIITLYHIIFYNNHLILIGLFIDQSFLVV